MPRSKIDKRAFFFFLHIDKLLIFLDHNFDQFWRHFAVCINMTLMFALEKLWNSHISFCFGKQIRQVL